MRLFAIGDLHLPGGDEKPMNIFGDHWEHHFERICEDWCARVSENDPVLIPGDISWAMQMADALPDLEAIGRLPGRKVLCKGNHDYWWSSVSRIRAVLPEGMSVIQHDALDLGELVVCGTRGWVFPTGDDPLSSEDETILKRELIRLELSLKEAVRLAGGRPIVVILHYPPLFDQQRETPFTAMLEKYPVHTVVYGHLHGPGIRIGYNGCRNGIRYHLVSCDALDFKLKEIEIGEN